MAADGAKDDEAEPVLSSSLDPVDADASGWNWADREVYARHQLIRVRGDQVIL
jgi:hypothetical protein